MTVTIREANGNDFEDAGALFFEELQFHVDLLPTRFQLAEPMITLAWFEEIMQNPEKVLLVAEENGRILGQILLNISKTPDDPIIKPRKFVYVDEIGVTASYRGQGIGKQLMAAAKAWAQSQGIAEIELNVWEQNGRAIGFYEELGYQTVRRRMWIRVD
ncbi:MAG: GNAT family N-acetyltransferase [Chloroflexi bacterium]|nr:MAG: GNAT family N-acetyltransferase [Chloroflexota bacterium]